MSTIPRFLLPRRGPLWQTSASSGLASSGLTSTSTPSQLVRTQPPARRCARAFSSTAGRAGAGQSGGKPAGNILAKPTKFNPPSHGARLPRRNANGTTAPASQHYGGDLSAAEKAAQRARQYPGMMAPKGTWAHWFWTSRMLHMTITMTTLTGLALFTFVENFKARSPYVDLLPDSFGEVVAHPLDAAATLWDVMRLTEQHRVLEMNEKRQHRIDDVAKRTMYRKAHGMDETIGFASNGGFLSGWAKEKNANAPAAPQRNEQDDGTFITVDDASPVRGVMPEAEVPAAEPEKRKKYFGIF